jgi:DMSO/TMAO reductase YedYZ molybdopterin-dependent catalytic subunit
MDERDYDGDRSERVLHRLEREQGISRRQLLRAGAAALPLLAGLGHGAASPPWAQAQSPTPPAAASGPIVKPLPPEWFTPFGTNAEMRWDAAAPLGYEIPAERFFVRNHTATPAIDPATWRLRIFGSGLRRRRGEPEVAEFSLADLRRLPSRTQTAFIECAGNGRSFYASQQGTPAAGTQWRLGAVGVARWRGVPLSELLERAGLRRTAVDVMPQGLDANVVSGGVDQGRVRRPLPVDKALDDVLVAYEMNGRPLPPDHGFPARLVVPGWIGIASVKWLGQIEVSDQPLFSPWNTTSYRLTGPGYPADSPPITRQVVKSAFELPWGAQLPRQRPALLSGRSWSGGGTPIRSVDVSTDGGASWHRARLHGRNVPNAWVRWSVPWLPRAAGATELLARATDWRGQGQPASVPFNDNGYLFGAVVRHPVTVA